MLCCAVSALSYTMASICMRRLSTECPPSWAACNKEFVSATVAGAWLLCEVLRGRRVLPSWPTVGILLLLGLAVQLLGNLPSQWSYGIVGMAIVIAANVGTMLAASAAMGWLFLGERVSRRSIVAIALLLASLGLLVLGAEAAGRQISPESSPWIIAAAVAGPCFAGVIYALLSIAIRHNVTRDTRISVVIFSVTVMGVLSLGPISVHQLGVEELLQTPPEQYAWMYAAGFFNLLGFVAITKGLQLTTVVHANVLNASQVALAAMAGIMLFNEPRNPWLMLGVGLTALGVVLIDRPREAVETV
jgi:drug/metabolite transporter (DMT)-like permease